MKNELKTDILIYIKILAVILGCMFFLAACAVHEPAGSRAVSVIPAESVREAEPLVFSRADPSATVQSSYDEETLRLHVELQSYTENIRKRYERAGMSVTEVSVIGGEVGLRIKDGSAGSYIIGSEGTEEDFEELLQREISMTSRAFGSHTVVSFCLSPWKSGDTSEICIPVIFQLAKSSVDGTEGNDAYEYYGSLCYKVTVRIPQKGSCSFIVGSEEVSGSTELPI